MGLDGVGWGRYLVRSAAGFETLSFGDSLGRAILFGNISVVSDTHYNDVLGMYYVRHM